jgi:hypothetical protein
MEAWQSAKPGIGGSVSVARSMSPVAIMMLPEASKAAIALAADAALELHDAESKGAPRKQRQPCASRVSPRGKRVLYRRYDRNTETKSHNGAKRSVEDSDWGIFASKNPNRCDTNAEAGQKVLARPKIQE